MARLPICLLWLPVLAACPSKPPVDSVPTEDSDPYVYVDTGAVVETAESADTPEDTQGQDTATDSSPPDTDPPPVPVLTVFPQDLSVLPGAVFGLRVVSVPDSSGPVDVDPATITFQSTDAAVAQVDVQGTVTALNPGVVTLVAVTAEGEGRTTLEVRDDWTVEVTLVDDETGLPIPTGGVSVDGCERFGVDASGYVAVPVTTGSGLTLDIWAGDYVPVTLMGTVSRRLTVPLTTHARVDAEPVTFFGGVDYTGVDLGTPADMVVGLASPTSAFHPLLYDPESLLGEDRTVLVYGTSATIPSNFFVRGYVDDYMAVAPAGDVGLWSAAGAISIADITAVLEGDKDVITTFVEHLPDFSFGWSGLTPAAAGDGFYMDVAPSTPYSQVYEVDVPPLPTGFGGDESVVVLVLAEQEPGVWTVFGMGTGTGVAVAFAADPSVLGGTGNLWALGLAQVDGFGSGKALVYSASPLEADYAILPDFQTPPGTELWIPTTRDFSLTSDTRAHLVRVWLSSADGHDRILLLPSGPQTSVLTDPGFPFSFGRLTWDMRAFETTTDTFEGLVTRGQYLDAHMADILHTTARSTDVMGG